MKPKQEICVLARRETAAKIPFQGNLVSGLSGPEIKEDGR
jgi:hypothetical protein